MRSSLRLCFILMTGACGDHRQPVTLIEPDAMPDMPTVQPGSLVSVDTFGDSPVFIRYRLPGGEWQTPDDTGSTFEFLVDNEYELLAVCGNDTVGYEIGVTATTYDDSASTYLPCFTPIDVANAFEVTGTMKQPGTLVLDGVDSSTTPNWSFDIQVNTGVHDLFAYDANRVLVRRDLDITAAQAVADVDLVADGALFQTRPFTVGAAANETVRTSVLWSTQNSSVFLDAGVGTTAKLPDPSQLQSGDRQFVFLDASTTSTDRSAYVRQAPGAPTDIDLLPQIDGVTLTDTSATWTGALPGTDADLYSFAGNNSVYYQATAGWLAKHHEVVVDTAIDGFQPAWRVSTPEYVSFESTDGTNSVFRSTGVYSQAPSKRATISKRRHATRRLPR